MHHDLIHQTLKTNVTAQTWHAEVDMKIWATNKLSPVYGRETELLVKKHTFNSCKSPSILE
jgi:hypothetical protein